VQISIRGAQIPENIPDFEQAQNKWTANMNSSLMSISSWTQRRLHFKWIDRSWSERCIDVGEFTCQTKASGLPRQHSLPLPWTFCSLHFTSCDKISCMASMFILTFTWLKVQM
jgi:hypothetical protein